MQDNTVKELFSSILNEEKDNVRKLKNRLSEREEKAEPIEDDETEREEPKKVEHKKKAPKPVVKPKKVVKKVSHHKKN